MFLFDLNDNEDRTNYILNRLFEIAGDVNGFLLYPSMQIFTGEGKLLFSAKGESQLTEFIPVGNADLLDGNYQEETQADVENRSRLRQSRINGSGYSSSGLHCRSDRK